jgi:hypothetical protein
MKRGFESVGNARYRTPFAPPTNLGTPAPAHPLQALSPPNAEIRTPSVVPTTTASNKKTNVQIPYTRVVNDARHLPRERGELVFVRSTADATVAGKLRVSAKDRTEFLASVESVNERIKAADPDSREEEAEAWSVDGVLISTEREMDPEQLAWTSYEEPVTSTTAVLLALQGHTVLRNVFSDRAFVGDYCYVGLVQPRGKDPQWVPFSSQHLDMAYAPEPPTAPQLGFHGTATRKRVRVAFTEADAAGLCGAYCIGRVVDSAPTPGDVTVNVQVRYMTWAQLGVRHDEEHARLIPSGTVFKDSKGRVRRELQYDRWLYPPNQRIGRDCTSNDRILGLLRRWVRRRQLGGGAPRLPQDIGDYCLDQAFENLERGGQASGLDHHQELSPNQLQLFGPIVIAVCAIYAKWTDAKNHPTERAALEALAQTPSDDVALDEAIGRALSDAQADALIANIKQTLPDSGNANKVKRGLIDFNDSNKRGALVGRVLDMDDYDPGQRPLDVLSELAAALTEQVWAQHEAERRALALLGVAATEILVGIGGSDMLGDGKGEKHPDWIEVYLEKYQVACTFFMGTKAGPATTVRLADVINTASAGANWEDPFYDEDDFDGLALRLAAAAVIQIQGSANAPGYFATREWNEESMLGLLLRCAMALLLCKAVLLRLDMQALQGGP